MLDPPRRAVAHAEVALKLQCGHVGLGRSQQIERQEPSLHRQLAGRKLGRQFPTRPTSAIHGAEGAAEQRGLMSPGSALVVDLAVARKSRMPPVMTNRTAVALRPTRPEQRRPTRRRLSPVVSHELHQRQARLELHLIDRHHPPPHPMCG